MEPPFITGDGAGKTSADTLAYYQLQWSPRSSRGMGRWVHALRADPGGASMEPPFITGDGRERRGR